MSLSAGAYCAGHWTIRVRQVSSSTQPTNRNLFTNHLSWCTAPSDHFPPWRIRGDSCTLLAGGKTMITAIYTRVSTDKQTRDSQLHELRAYCQRRGWNTVTEYADVVKGSKFTRDGLDELMRHIRKGKVQTVVAFKLDRLGRSLSHLAALISEF